jgi:hypothetical protein
MGTTSSEPAARSGRTKGAAVSAIEGSKTAVPCHIMVGHSHLTPCQEWRAGGHAKAVSLSMIAPLAHRSRESG